MQSFTLPGHYYYHTDEKTGVQSWLSLKPRTTRPGPSHTHSSDPRPPQYSALLCPLQIRTHCELEYHASLVSQALGFYHQFLHPVPFLKSPSHFSRPMLNHHLPLSSLSLRPILTGIHSDPGQKLEIRSFSVSQWSNRGKCAALRGAA